jgi:hypothetical protein
VEHEDGVRRRLLEGLQESDLRVLREVGGVVDDDHTPRALERAEREVPLHLADLLDGDVLAVVGALLVDEPGDDTDVRM